MPWNPNGTPAEVQSPTALVLQYLSSKGLQPSAQNVSAALQMNASNPGAIPGLTNQAPPSPEASASTTASPSPSTTAPASAPSQPLPTPPIPPQQSAAPPSIPADVVGSSGGGADNSVALHILEALLGAGGIGALGYGASKLGGGAAAGGGEVPPITPGATPTTAEPMGNTPMPPSGRVMDVPSEAIGAPRSQAQLPAPQPSSPLETALLKALGGGEAPLQLAAPTQQPQVAGPQGKQITQQDKPAIKLPNETSGPTIPLSTSVHGAQGHKFSGAGDVGEAADWSGILRAIASGAKKVAR